MTLNPEAIDPADADLARRLVDELAREGSPISDDTAIRIARALNGVDVYASP